MLSFYGIDWLAAVSLWLHIYLLGNKSWWAWPVGLEACLSFLVLGLMTGTWGTVVPEFVVIALMIRSWMKWSKHGRE